MGRVRVRRREELDIRVAAGVGRVKVAEVEEGVRVAHCPRVITSKGGSKEERSERTEGLAHDGVKGAIDVESRGDRLELHPSPLAS